MLSNVTMSQASKYLLYKQSLFRAREYSVVSTPFLLYQSFAIFPFFIISRFFQIITSPGLPYGWEKSIDRKTGRVYYIDHTTKSTHWELPPDFYASRERDAALKQKRKAPEPPIAKDVGQSKPSLKRSLSTPNLADMDADKENAKPITPIVDRSSKPL